MDAREHAHQRSEAQTGLWLQKLRPPGRRLRNAHAHRLKISSARTTEPRDTTVCPSPGPTTAKTTACRHTKCGKIGHDYYECLIAFFEHFATRMPGFTAEGIIAGPHLYWAKGAPGTQISSKIAALWEQHSWTTEMQTEMSTTINVSALR
jgi:hypothetical protein